MLDKDSQTQKASDNSVAVQSGRDTYIGMQYSEVKELFELLWKSNFPKLRQEAVEESKKYIDAFARDFFSKIEGLDSSIDVEKRFKNPAFQASINDAVMNVARKTDKAEIDLLGALICDKLTSQPETTLDLLQTETIKVMERVNRASIVFCAFVLFVKQLKPSRPNERMSLSELEDDVKCLFPLDDISKVDLPYLKYIRICTGEEYFKKNFIEHLKSDFDNVFHEGDVGFPLKEGNNFYQECPIMANIILKFGFDNLEQFDSAMLTVVGRSVGAAYLRSKGLSVGYPER